MAIRVPDITSRIRVDTKGLDQAERKVATSESRMSKAFSGIAKAAGAAFAAKAIIDFGAASIQVASDLSEEVSKSEAVFGRSSDAVQRFAKTTTESLGISEVDALSATGTFGNLFTALKIGEEQAGAMATELVTLAGDLASFNNVDTETALDALRSGLAGETEPLKKFGVNMNDATLKAQAFADGLIESEKDALTPAVKAQAAYALILEQTTTAQGDAAKTIGGLAGQQRVFSASVEDLQAKLGGLLLPAANAATTALVGFVDALSNADELGERFGNFLEDNQAGATIFGSALFASAIPATARFVDLIQTSVRVKALEWFSGITTAARNAGGAIGLAGKALRGLGTVGTVALIASIANELRAAKQHAQEFAEAVTDEIDTTTLAGQREAAQALNEAYTDQSAALDDVMARHEGLGGFLKNMAGLLPGVHNEFGEVTESVLALRDALEQAERDMIKTNENFMYLRTASGLTDEQIARLAERVGVDMTDAWVDIDDAMLGAIAGLGKATAAEEGTAVATQTLTDKVATATERVSAYKAMLDSLFGEVFGVEEATSNYEAAVDRLTESLKTNGKTLDLNKEKGRQNRQAIRDLVAASQARIAAIYEENNNVDKANDKARRQRQALRDVLEQTGLTKREIDTYITTLKNIPRKGIDTPVTADTGPAEKAINDFLGLYEERKLSMQVDAKVSGGTGGAGVLGGQTGRAGEMALAAASRFGQVVTSAFRPGDNGYHGDPVNPAHDIAGGNMLGAAKYLAGTFGANLRELIHTPLGYGIKHGKVVPLSYWGAAVNKDHWDHVHVAHSGGPVLNAWPTMPGLRHDERPAVLQVGETVIPKGQSGRGVSVTQVFNERVNPKHVAAALAWELM